MGRSSALAALRKEIAGIEGGERRAKTLSFGVPDIDAHMGGGLRLGAWHELTGEGLEHETCAAPAAFSAALARVLSDRGEVVWVLRRDDLYAPGLACLGLAAERLITVCAISDDQALAVVEEALATPGVAAVIGEAEAVPLTAGRRLQLAAERTGSVGLILRRRPFGGKAKSDGKAGSVAFSRWRVSGALSQPAAGSPGLGRARWNVDLLRCRGGRAGAWTLEEAQGHGPHPFALVAPLGDGRLATEDLQKLAG